MTVSELIEELQDFDQDAIVYATDMNPASQAVGYSVNIVDEGDDGECFLEFWSVTNSLN